MNEELNGYELSRTWFDFCFENPEKVKPNHSAIYFFAIEHCNRLGWKEKFGLPSSMSMEATGIKSYNTYIKSLNDIIDWGFIKLIQKSKNQYSSNIIALSKFDKALNKALDKAFIKHKTKQSESTQQSISESIDSINKQLTNKPINQLNQETKNQLKGFLKKLEVEFKNEEKPKIEPQKIVDLYHQFCKHLPKVQVLSKGRKATINARLKEHGLNKITEVFQLTARSNFLNGENKDEWNATFDWLLSPTNFVKVIEGNFKNKNNGGSNKFSTNRG